jgi:hypothetical protein
VDPTRRTMTTTPSPKPKRANPAKAYRYALDQWDKEQDADFIEDALVLMERYRLPFLKWYWDGGTIRQWRYCKLWERAVDWQGRKGTLL